jgi:hypothetical protein
MQTIPVNSKLSTRAVHVPNVAIKPFSAPTPSVAADRSSQTAEGAPAHTLPELDAMLIRDPNLGAIHGLRVALLFNAGLALSGLLVWEIWSMLAA